jgi:hypothetical protein
LRRGGRALRRRHALSGDRAAVVSYKATAKRADGGEPYVVRASSAYVRDGAAWKLAIHQQTPIEHH